MKDKNKNACQPVSELEESRTVANELESSRSLGEETEGTDGLEGLCEKVLRFSPHPIVKLDASGKVLDWNPATTKATGFALDKAKGRCFGDFMPASPQKEAFSKVLEKAGTERHFSHLDLLLRCKDGTVRNVLANVIPSVDPGGKITGFAVACTDLTELEQVGRLLRESEERYQRLLEVSSDAIAVGKSGVIVEANQGFASMTGRTVPEVIGMSIEELTESGPGMSLVSIFDRPDDSPDFPHSVEMGSSVLTEVRAETIPYEGSPATMAAIRDVTDIRKTEEALRGSEERFRAVFESDPDCVFIKDRDLRFTEVNPAMEKFFALPASKIIGRKAEDLYGPEAAKKIGEWDRRVLEGETIEEEHTRPYGGQMFTFLDVRAPVRDGQGNVIGICGISRDITERKRAVPVPRSGDRSYPSRAMTEIMEQVSRIAATDGTVLLQGESGTGKDYLARWIHDHSPRSDSPFFSVNCAALPHELAESELFGHEAAAFTGAKGRKRGLLELAEGGTLLLNEIGELPTTLQAKLLTFLDSKAFVRVGGGKPVHVDARLIAATHRDLTVEVSEGRFLEPLFYRLNVFPIRVPALRERSEDIPILCEELMARIASDLDLSSTPVPDSHDIHTLAGYHWPGNVRELRNVLERSLMLWTGGRFQLALPTQEPAAEEWAFRTNFSPGKTLRDISGQLIHALCLEALRRSRGNRREAARALGISRDSLYRYIARFGIGAENQTRD